MSFTLEGFEIGNRIGAGGFGEVWEARQIGVDRPVAIKVGNTAINDATDQLRFERECKALGRLSTHANIVTVYTSGQLPDGRPILVLEFVDGGTLQRWALNNASTEAQIMNIGADLASALVEAHSHQILHRDLKPQNVLLRTNGEAILADFGIAQMQDGLRTVTGNVTASAAYAAPEVLDGNRATEQSDIYGIGICMLAAATQSTPFTDADDTTLYPVLTRVLTAEPPDITEFGYSAEFNTLVQRLLQKDPANRFNNATEVLTELRRLNVGPDSYQRVAPTASTSGGGAVDDDPPTEGPTVTPNNAGKLVQHSPHPGALQPAPQPAPQPAAKPAAHQPPAQQPAPQPVAHVQPEQPAPATVAVPHQPTGAPPAQGYPQNPNVAVGAETVPASVAPAAAATGGTSPAKLGAIIGGVLVAAFALFFIFGRGGGDDPVAGVNTTQSTQSTQSTEDTDTTASQQSQSAESGGESQPAAESSSGSSSSSLETSAQPSAPIPAGEPVEVSGSIEIALDFRDFPVDLVAGQEVSVHLTAMNGSCDGDDEFDLKIKFLDPSGEQLYGDGNADIWGCKAFGTDWMADVDGVHTIRFVSGGNPPATGTFKATIATKRRTQEELASGDLVNVSATIDRALDSIAYQVDLQAGQSISLALNSMNGSCESDDEFELRIGLFDPSGEEVGDISNAGIWGCGTSNRWFADETGMHSVVFFSADGPGAFAATLGRPISARDSLDSGARVHEVTGNIGIPRDDVGFEIDLAAGQQVSVDLTAMNGSCENDDKIDMRIVVLGPDGEPVDDDGNVGIWGCKAYGPWAAAVDGTHTVQFRDAAGTTGTFEATIGRLGG